MGWPAAKQIGEFAERMQFGVDTTSLPLARAHLPGLGRGEIRALVAAGFDSVATLRDASADVLARYLSPSQIQTFRESQG